MSEITLRKYHGLGNDYLVYDPVRNETLLTERQVEKLCRRNIGVGADGILYGPFFDEESGDEGIRVRIFNPDGSEAEKSGNGIRKGYGICEGELLRAGDEGGKNRGYISGRGRRADACRYGLREVHVKGDSGGWVRGGNCE